MYNYFMETLEAFYKRITHPLPQNLDNGIGHFNVFTRQECIEIPYSRKDYFKITFLKGNIGFITPIKLCKVTSTH
jgi:hypothetical protein